MGRHILPVAFTLLTVASEAFSQSTEIETDRPDQTEASSVVGAGMIQIESGFVFTRAKVNGTDRVLRTNDLASTLVRIGIWDRVELRLISGYTTIDYDSPGTDKDSGLQPVSLGTKISLTTEQGFRPEIAFIGHITLPWLGKESFQPEFVTPDFRFSLSHTLSERFSLGYNLGMFWEGAQSYFVYTAALGAGIAGPLGAFIEFYGEIPENGNWQNHFHAGLTLLLTPDLQLDTSFSTLLDHDQKEHFFNAGISYRFAAWNK